jgi:protein O-mannosyl-transferase
MAEKSAISGSTFPVWLFYLTLVLGVCVAHGPVVNNDFITLDDQQYVYTNPQVLKGLTYDSAVWAFTSFNAGNWHPVTMLSHMLDVTLFGLNPAGHHATALVFQCLNACLIFLVLWRLTGSGVRSWFVAALFAVHPVHVESVAWVSSRKDVLSVFFLCLSLLTYLNWLETRARGPWVCSILLYALALMSKPTAVVFPMLLMLLDFWPLNRTGVEMRPGARLCDLPRTPWLTLLAEKAPYLALAVLGAVVTVKAQSAHGAISGTQQVAMQDRIMNAGNSYVQYLSMAVYPRDLSLIYPLRPIPWATGVIQIGILAAMTAAALWAGFKRGVGYVTVGWLWYLLALVPMIGLVQVGVQARADRYAYIPFIGLYLLVVWGVSDLVGCRPQLRKGVIACCVAWLIALAALAHSQSRLWESPVTLMLHGIQATGENPDLEDSLGRTYNLLGDYESAARHFHNSLVLRPGDAETMRNLAFVLMVLDQPGQAVAVYTQLEAMGPLTAGTRINMGWAFLRSGAPEKARRIFEQCVGENDKDVEALTGLGAALGALGDVEQGLAVLQKARALSANPGTVDYQIALVLVNASRAPEALPVLRGLVEAQPGNIAARRLWAEALDQAGRRPEALAVLQALLKERPDDKPALQALEKMTSSPPVLNQEPSSLKVPKP